MRYPDLLFASCLYIGVAVRWNSIFVFVASAASFGFYMSAVYTQYSHARQPSSFIQFDVTDSRDRTSDRNRPQRDRPLTAVHRAPAAKPHPEVLQSDPSPDLHPDQTMVSFQEETFVGQLLRILAAPYPGF